MRFKHLAERIPKVWVLHPDEVAVLDANAEALGIDPMGLMVEASGAIVRDIAMAASRGVFSGEAWFLCGPGRNGGDGWMAADLLAQLDVPLRPRILSTVPLGEGALSAEHLDMPQEVHVIGASEFEPPLPKPASGETMPAVIVDCLLGAGQRGPIRGRVRTLLDRLQEHLGAHTPRVLAADLPTGVGSQRSVRAIRTITFHQPKLSMYGEDGRLYPEVGALIVAPLPWPSATTDVGPGDALRYPSIDPSSTKGDRGRVLVIGGGPFHGAPLLAGLAAARVGADLVHVAMPRGASSRAAWPTSLIPEVLPDEDHLTSASLDPISERISSGRGVQSIVIGPGLGTHQETLEAVHSILDLAKGKDIPVVVDADAIAALPRGVWPSGLRGVATPHLRERQRWIEDVDPSVILDAAARTAEWRMHRPEVEDAVVVTTGAVDELVGLAGRFARAEGGHPRMAMGGSGDVLAGAIGGLLAVGMPAWPASRLATHLMRRAGAEAASVHGPGMVAEDVPEHLARVLADLISKTS